jgi:hypothetical protein
MAVCWLAFCVVDFHLVCVLQVQMAVHELRESANSRTNKLQQEMSTMQDSTSSIKVEWSVHMEKTESNHFEDTSAVESGRKALEEVLHNWYRLLMQSFFLISLSFFVVDTIFHRGIMLSYAFFPTLF